MTNAFWIDAEYDRDHASDGVSRYGHYVHQHPPFEPWTDNDRAVELAVFAWRRATGPIMAPGYVRRHLRITSTHLERSEWDGSLLATVDVITGWPEALRTGTKNWRGWPTETLFFGGGMRYLEPSGEELSRAPYLLPSASLRFTVPTPALPQPPTRSGSLLAACQESVALVVAGLNETVNSLIDALERS